MIYSWLSLIKLEHFIPWKIYLCRTDCMEHDNTQTYLRMKQKHWPTYPIYIVLFSIHTHLDQLEARLSLVVQGSEGPLQGSPGHALCTACLAHQHGAVPRVFCLIKLDDFGHGERSHLQTPLIKFRRYSFFQLQQGNSKRLESWVIL